jgi:hypothetical protein
MNKLGNTMIWVVGVVVVLVLIGGSVLLLSGDDTKTSKSETGSTTVSNKEADSSGKLNINTPRYGSCRYEENDIFKEKCIDYETAEASKKRIGSGDLEKMNSNLQVTKNACINNDGQQWTDNEGCSEEGSTLICGSSIGSRIIQYHEDYLDRDCPGGFTKL